MTATEGRIRYQNGTKLRTLKMGMIGVGVGGTERTIAEGDRAAPVVQVDRLPATAATGHPFDLQVDDVGTAGPNGETDGATGLVGALEGDRRVLGGGRWHSG